VQLWDLWHLMHMRASLIHFTYIIKIIVSYTQICYNDAKNVLFEHEPGILGPKKYSIP
jgi:hypothetical protein